MFLGVLMAADNDIRVGFTPLEDKISPVLDKINNGQLTVAQGLRTLAEQMTTTYSKGNRLAEGHVRTLERQNTLMAQTPLERINRERDIELRNLDRYNLSAQTKLDMERRINQIYAERVALLNRVNSASGSGSGSISDARIGSAVATGLERGVTQNARLASVFATQMLGLGPIIRMAFPVAGVLAFTTVFVEMAENVYKFYKEMRDAPDKMRASGRSLLVEFRDQNDELLKTNIHLENATAKLYRKQPNLLKEAIIDARVEAELLGKTMDGMMEALKKHLEENKVGVTEWMMGQVDDKGVREIMFGKGGYTGYKNQIDLVNDKLAKTPYDAVLIAQRDKLISDAKAKLQALIPVEQHSDNLWGGSTGINSSKIQYNVRTATQRLEDMRTNIGLRQQNTVDTDANKQAHLDRQAADYTRGLIGKLNVARRGELDPVQKISQEVEDEIARMNDLKKYSARNEQIIRRTGDYKIGTIQDKIGLESSRDWSGGQYETQRQGMEQSIEARQKGFEKQRETTDFGRFNEGGMADEYRAAIAGARQLRDVDEQRIHQMMALRMSAKEIETAQKKQDEDFQKRIGEAQQKYDSQHAEMLKQHKDLQDQIRKDAVESARKDADLYLSLAQKGETGDLSYDIKYRKAMSHTQVGYRSQQSRLREDEQDRMATAQLEYQQRGQTIGQESERAQAARDAELDPKKRQEWEVKLTELKREGIKSNWEYEQQILAAEREYTLETIALWDKQYDEIKSKTQGLLHAAFTNPKNFAKQFHSTIRDEALKPIEQHLAEAISAPLTTMLHGARPAPIGHARSNPMYVEVVNGGGGGGTGAPGVRGANGSTGGTFTIPGPGGAPISLPISMFNGGGGGWSGNAFTDVPGGVSSLPGSVLNPTTNPLGSIGYATSGSSGSRGSSGGGWLGNLTKNVFGGKTNGSDPGGGWTERPPGSGSGNWRDVLGNLKAGPSGGWGSFSHAPGKDTVGWNSDGKPTDEYGNVTSEGAINGVGGVAGTAMVAGGMMLAQRGLMGPDMGSGKGVLEGAVGGAMIGAKYGGLLGAGIGAGVGAAIGTAEWALGDVSPQIEAKNLAKSLYGVKISDQQAQSIVSIANSKYGGRVSVAIRSQEVKSMLLLVAQSTNQKSSVLEAEMVHSASLVQTSNGLQQQATYSDGGAFTYASSLSTSGPAGTQLPTSAPGYGPTTVVVSPAATQDLWARGTAQAITGNPGMVANSAYNGDSTTNSRINSMNLMSSPSTFVG